MHVGQSEVLLTLQGCAGESFRKGLNEKKCAMVARKDVVYAWLTHGRFKL